MCGVSNINLNSRWILNLVLLGLCMNSLVCSAKDVFSLAYDVDDDYDQYDGHSINNGENIMTGVSTTNAYVPGMVSFKF